MKTLMVVPRLNIGGAETYVYTLASGLKAKGYDIVVVSGGGVLADKLSAHGIKHYFCPIRLNRHIAAYRIADIIKREKVTLVHANSTAAAYPVAMACRRTLTPWVMTAHGVFGRAEAIQGIDQADAVICVSEFLRHFLIDRTGMESSLFTTVYNGIDLNLFNPTAVQENFRQRWALSQEDFAVGIVGRMAKLNGKGHMELIGSMRNQPKDTAWKLLLVGQGKAQWRLRLITMLHGLNRRITFAGHQTDMPSVINACDVIVLASPIETFGLVLAEGMAMGKPVIAYAVGGTPEAIEHGVSGFLVKHGNKEELISIIDRLYKDRELCRQIGENGMRRVHSLFNSERMVEETIMIYKKVLSRKADKTCS